MAQSSLERFSAGASAKLVLIGGVQSHRNLDSEKMNSPRAATELEPQGAETPGKKRNPLSSWKS